MYMCMHIFSQDSTEKKKKMFNRYKLKSKKDE